jgi:hypothetical protein
MIAKKKLRFYFILTCSFILSYFQLTIQFILKERPIDEILEQSCEFKINYDKLGCVCEKAHNFLQIHDIHKSENFEGVQLFLNFSNQSN